MQHILRPIVVLWIILITQGGCDSARTLAVDGGDDREPSDAGAVDTPAAVGGPVEIDAGEPGEPDLTHDPYCTTNADCASEQLCRLDGCRASGGKKGRCESRPESCGTVYAPVCGCDGITYGNSCGAHAAGTNVAHDGQCAECGNLPYPVCPGGMVCDFDDCGLTTGICVEMPHEDLCMTGGGSSVCGCDGNTYDNDCIRVLVGVALDHDGPCKS